MKCAILYQNDPKEKPQRKNNKVIPFGQKKPRTGNELMYKILKMEIESNLKKNLKYLNGDGVCLLVS